ncbi:MAG: hypothetical protein ACE5HS_21600 [bacterium]
MKPMQMQSDWAPEVTVSRRRVRSAGIVVMSLCLMMITVPAAAQVDQERAEAYFKQAAALCEREGVRLWGVSLCGPMVFADPVTGTIATNQQAPEAPRPRALGYANAAMEWGGVRWSTFVWQMIPADDEAARARIMLHELFHRVQRELGLYVPVSQGENDHLDTLVGRYWMQLEWRALARGLGTSGSERTDAIRDALAFRMTRRTLFPGAAEKERASEINEGLAQYTATVAAVLSSDKVAADAIEQLTQSAQKESFVRTFAYASGAAYGILLNAWSPGWTRQIKVTDDLGQLLMTAANIQPSENVKAAARRYGGPELWTAEEKREMERQTRLAELRHRFVDGPVLVLPRGRNASFITTGVTPIPGAGTIYPSFRVTGEWGSIEAEQVLMSVNGSKLTVPAPVTVEGSTLSGDGWTVTLASGWVMRPGPRTGDFEVVHEDY